MKKIAKAKAGTSLGMKSVKAGYDSNPGVTRADIISAAKMKAGKAKNGAKLAAKKPIKKAQKGDDVPMMEGKPLSEAVVTASRIVDKPTKSKKPQKNYTKDLIKRANKMNKNQSGFSKIIAGKRYKDGGEVEMAKKGASVKKKMMSSAKCKSGC